MSRNEKPKYTCEFCGSKTGGDDGFIYCPYCGVPYDTKGYVTDRPLPCVRDEHGEIHDQKVKWLIAKIDEELNEIKELIYHEVGGDDVLYFLRDDEIKELIAEEAADTITAITTFCHYCGIDAEMRDDAQRRVNAKNRERGRL